MVTATNTCLRSQVGTHLYTYVEAGIGETSQDVDPEDGDFQAPWLSCVGPFSVPLGQLFLYVFPRFFVFFARFWVPVLGPKNGPKNGPRIQILIRFLL